MDIRGELLRRRRRREGGRREDLGTSRGARIRKKGRKIKNKQKTTLLVRLVNLKSAPEGLIRTACYEA